MNIELWGDLMAIKNFPRDLMAEKELGNFLEKNYYPKIGLHSFQKCTTTVDQNAGVDVKAKINQEILLIDEKGLLSIPHPINTFALELAYEKDQTSKIGWLFDESKITNNYLFCWVKRDKVDIAVFKEDNIHYVLALLVNRNALLKYLKNKYGITKDSARNEVQKIVQQGIGGRLKNLSVNSSSRYHYSNDLPEKPVNIVLDKTDFVNSNAVVSFHLVKRSGISIATL